MTFGKTLGGLVKDDFFCISVHITDSHHVGATNAAGRQLAAGNELFNGGTMHLKNLGRFCDVPASYIHSFKPTRALKTRARRDAETSIHAGA